MSASVIRGLKQVPSLRDVARTGQRQSAKCPCAWIAKRLRNLGSRPTTSHNIIAIALRGYAVERLSCDRHANCPCGCVSVARCAKRRRLERLQAASSGRKPDSVDVDGRIETRNAVVRHRTRKPSDFARHQGQSRRRRDHRRRAQGDNTTYEECAAPPGYRWTFGENFNHDDDAGSKNVFQI